ncbi:MAG TPA: 2TM domain-containing protein [Prochlorococcaceae cyanobacterium AMR_MDS_5431]|nr:2TM domain-containing protein [Prochlorococcaceae cyanobacterium AMR_MDS_5431]
MNNLPKSSFMPIRWYGSVNPSDSKYRHFERIVDFCIHAGIFAATNSGLWFAQNIHPIYFYLTSLTLGWTIGLLLHLFMVMSLQSKN